MKGKKPMLTSFSSGELSPLMGGRIDFNKYAAGCSQLENFIPLPTGPVTKRPGFEVIGRAKGDDVTSADRTDETRLIPFVFSNTQSFMLEFSEYKIRFYKDGALVMNGASAYEVTTTYRAKDVWELDYAQCADVLYIVHPKFAPRKLTRLSQVVDTSWSFATLDNLRGPCRDLMKDRDIELDAYTSPSMPGVTTKMTSTNGYAFKPGDVGSVWRLKWKYGVEEDSVEGLETDDDGLQSALIGTRSGSFTGEGQTTDGLWVPASEKAVSELTLSGTWTGTVVLLRMGLVYDVWTGQTKIEGNKFWAYMANTTKSLLDWSAKQIPQVYALKAQTYTTGPINYVWNVYEESISKTILVPAGYTYKIEVWNEVAGTITGKIGVQRSWDGGQTWDTQLYLDTFPADEDYTNSFTKEIIVRLNATTLRSGTLSYRITIYDDTTGKYRYFKVTNYSAANIVYGYMQPDEDEEDDDIPTDVATNLIWPGAWSTMGTGYEAGTTTYCSTYCGWFWPSKVCLFEDRLVFASTYTEPHKIWMSKSGDWENFEIGPNDDDAIEISLASDVVDKIEWLSSGNVLLVGTAGGIYRIGAGNPDEAVTPSNISGRMHVRYGSGSVRPLQVGNRLLFVNRNRRRIYECKLDDVMEGYVASDVTILAEHVGNGVIRELAYQETPYSLVWVVMDDGTMATLTYVPDQEVYGWARHSIAGASYVECIASIPGEGPHDEIWAIVRKDNMNWTAGNPYKKRTIERLAQFPEMGDTDLTERILVDSAITSYDSAITTLDCSQLLGATGYSRTIGVIADGDYIGTFALAVGGSNPTGVISLGATYTDVIAGIVPQSKLKTMRLEVGDQGNTVQGRRKEIGEVVLRVYQSIGGSIGGAAGDVDSIPSLTSLTTDDITIPAMRGGLGRDGCIYIEHLTPEPFTLLAIMPSIKIQE